jgi:hypothetical protein
VIFSPKQAKDPRKVFTPREPKVNEQMYVRRPDLEEALVSSLYETKHLILHGESGSGKSWLYKNVLDRQNIVFDVANLANASRFGAICSEFDNMLNRQGLICKTSFTEAKNAELNAGVAKGGLGHTGSYEVGVKEPFEALLENLRNKAGDRRAFLVLDNLESIFDSEAHLKELADLITLLDDNSYASYGVKFLIVGVPSGLQRYFFSTPNMGTVGNRVKELPEVFRFTDEQTSELVKKGFVFELEYLDETSTYLEKIIKHVIWVTDRIPQRVHEYCLTLALEYEKKGSFAFDDLETSDRKWMRESLYQAYSTIEGSMNEIETKVQRRNQVVYSIGQIQKSGFRSADVETSIRQDFPNSTRDTIINVNQILSDLAKRENPVIRRSPKGDNYVFTDPVYRMCIRAMLSKTDSEQVVKVELDSLFDIDF